MSFSEIAKDFSSKTMKTTIRVLIVILLNDVVLREELLVNYGETGGTTIKNLCYNCQFVQIHDKIPH